MPFKGWVASKGRVANIGTTRRIGLVAVLLVGCAGPAPTPYEASPGQARAATVLSELDRLVREQLDPHVNAQEDGLARIEEEVLKPLEQALLDRDSRAVASLLLPGAQLPTWAHPEPSSLVRSADGIREYSAEPRTSSETGSTEAFLAQFDEVRHARLEVHESKVEGQQASLKAQLDLRGVDHTHGLRHDRGAVELALALTDEGWRIQALRMKKQEILTAAVPRFKDTTATSGLDTVPLHARQEALRRGGYAITVGDIDGNQSPDLFVGGWGDSRLYLNDGKGSFRLADDRMPRTDRVKAAALSDLDNDGDRDLALTRFVDDKTEDVLILLNDGTGRFSAHPDAVHKTLSYDRAMPLTVADFDQDGQNDLYVGFPGARDFTYIDDRPNPLNTQGLFLNRGNARFEDQTLAMGLDVDPSRRSRAAYPHAAAKADFNGDGRSDLLIADDRRGPSLVHVNSQEKGFVEASGTLGLHNQGWGMGVAVGDYDNDGLPDIYYSNIDFLAARRVDQLRGPDSEPLFHGNRLYRNLGNNRFADVTASAGVGWAGEAAAGATWFDYDLDGDLDLYVLNGLWTGPGDQDLSSLFTRAFTAEMQLEGKSAPAGLDDISLRNPGFKNMIIQALTHYTGTVSALGEAPTNRQPSLSLGGNQRNALFRNNSDGTFTEVAFLVGLDSPDDGYMPATGDIDQDGDIDVFVRNCDPGTPDHQYPSLRLFENGGNDNRSLKVFLSGDGVRSASDAIGAKVRVTLPDSFQVRELESVSGAAQSELVAHFGLSQADRVEELRVTWPSGSEQVFRDVPHGTIEVTEDKSSTFGSAPSPPDRSPASTTREQG